MPNFLKNLFKFSNLKSASAYAESSSFLDKAILFALLEKIKTKIKLENFYPPGIVVELKKDIDPSIMIGGVWKDITDLYIDANPNTKKWQRIKPVDSNKTDLEKYYNQYKDLDKSLYIESTWVSFENALETAKGVINDPEATQETVDGACRALLMAYMSLRLKS